MVVGKAASLFGGLAVFFSGRDLSRTKALNHKGHKGARREFRAFSFVILRALFVVNGVVFSSLRNSRTGTLEPMRVQVLFFGLLKDVAGRSNEWLDLPEGSTLADLLAHYELRIPKLQEILPSLALSVNQQYAGPGTVLGNNDEVGLLPPVSGGSRR